MHPHALAAQQPAGRPTSEARSPCDRRSDEASPHVRGPGRHSAAVASSPVSRLPGMGGAPKTLASGRSGDGYNAHSYHTKVPPPAIAQLIAEKLPNGGTVADAFCGSGTTGIGAAIAEGTTSTPYDVVLGDLSPFAAFLAEAQNSPPEPALFERAARAALARAGGTVRDLWTTTHADGTPATILYTIWSEVWTCPGCGRDHRFWDLAVDHVNGGIRRRLTCPACSAQFRKEQGRRATERAWDGFAQCWIERPRRTPVQIAYEVAGRKHLKAPDDRDLATIAAAAELPTPSSAPCRLMLDRSPPWGDLYRAGYHQGITHVHHFYTWRNFVTIGHLWEAALESHESQGVRFLVSSYNLSHSTLMSRVVFKRGQRRPVLTGYQTGTLYIGSLPVEKNPLVGIERSKLPAVQRAFALTHQRRGNVRVAAVPAQAWRDIEVPIDYFFLDPPFGGNIPYAEANFIAEAWLGKATQQEHEAIVSDAQGKSADDYRSLLAESFDALASRLSRNGSMTVMFHSAAPEPWNALNEALGDARLKTGRILRLDKRQGSLKQVQTRGAVEGDLLIDVVPARRGQAAAKPIVVESHTAWLARNVPASADEIDLATMRKLFSEFVADRVRNQQPLEVSAAEFYSAVRELIEGRQGRRERAA